MAKQVRFDPSTSAIGRPHRDDAAVDGESCSSNCWLTDEDYNRIRRGMKKDVRKARRAMRISGDDGDYNAPPPSLNEDETTTLRGIEHLQSVEVLQRQIHAKDCAIEAVFREQERQATMGRALDGGAIAKVYAAHSGQARQAALVYAASDEAFVRADRRASATTTTCTTTSATPTDQQYLDVLQKSIAIDLGTSQAHTVADITDTTIEEGSARPTPSRSAGGMHAPSAVNPLQQQQQDDQDAPNHSLGSWLNHHDSLRLSGSKHVMEEGPSHRSSECTDTSY